MMGLDLDYADQRFYCQHCARVNYVYGNNPATYSYS